MRAEILEAGAVPSLVALLHGETAWRAAGALCHVALNASGAAAIRSAGGIVPLVALLHPANASTAKHAAAALLVIALTDEQSRPAILGVVHVWLKITSRA